jgi:hypothetical protein
LHVTRGNAGKKSGWGERWSLRKLGEVPTPLAREAHVVPPKTLNCGVKNEEGSTTMSLDDNIA